MQVQTWMYVVDACRVDLLTSLISKGYLLFQMAIKYQGSLRDAAGTARLAVRGS